jgi:thioredoxin 1
VLVEFAERDDTVCRMEAPVLDKVLRRFADRLSVVQTDVGSHPAEADRYGITAVPTMILFIDGVEKLRVVGFRPVEELAAALEEALPSAPSPPPAST